jgi:hypothetical protein
LDFHFIEPNRGFFQHAQQAPKRASIPMLRCIMGKKPFSFFLSFMNPTIQY